MKASSLIKRFLFFSFVCLSIFVIFLNYDSWTDNKVASAGHTLGSFVTPKLKRGEAKIVKVDVVVMDNDASDEYIQRASFNNHNIPLSSPNPTTIRGRLHTQVNPGTYTVRWTVKKDAYVWPREVEHVEEIIVSTEDIYMVINIQGDSLYIQ